MCHLIQTLVICLDILCALYATCAIIIHVSAPPAQSMEGIIEEETRTKIKIDNSEESETITIKIPGQCLWCCHHNKVIARVHPVADPQTKPVDFEL